MTCAGEAGRVVAAVWFAGDGSATIPRLSAFEPYFAKGYL